MWRLSHFGNDYNCNGAIRDALAVLTDVQTAVGNHIPYVNNQQADIGHVPPEGATVTFRPRMSGKAFRPSKHANGRRRPGHPGGPNHRGRSRQ